MYRCGHGVEHDNARAVRWFTHAAEQGHYEAQLTLGRIHYKGVDVPKDEIQAVEWFTRAANQGDHEDELILDYIAAEQGDAERQYELGRTFQVEMWDEREFNAFSSSEWYGIFDEVWDFQNCDSLAEIWYRRAAEQGHVKAQRELGILYANGAEFVDKDIEEATYWLTRAAECGDSEAQYVLGCMIADNLLPHDNFEYQDAVKWFIPAAEQGDAVAQYHLGCVLRGAEPVEAGKWFVHAARNGCVDAQHQLGLMCVSGVGVPQDHNQAIEWFARAAEQGHADALTRAAELGHADSQCKLGDNYDLAENQTQAVWWYTLAAEQGHAWAQYQLVCMSRGAEPGEALEWFTPAAEQGNAEAQHALGKLYFSGEGVPQNHVQAVLWFTRAAEQGHTGAQFELGRMYADGEGVRADNIQAFAWAHLASTRGRIGAAPLRDEISANLTQEQLAEAHQLSRELEARIQHSR